MPSVAAYGAVAADAPLQPVTIDRREPRPGDVVIDIEYSGICHSDIHTVRAEWRTPDYPLVPGHEIVGTVREVGPDVSQFRVGQRVGVGVIVDSCRECANCDAHLEQYCLAGPTLTYGGKDRVDGSITQGGYATAIVTDQRFVVAIPDGLDPAATAPLLCAGITTYSPLKHWGVGPDSRVAVVGMGGLGHVAVKIAAAMGADVSVLSHSLRKADDGLRFGAHRYLTTDDRAGLKQLRGELDLIVVTTSAQIDLAPLMRLLKTGGTTVILGLPEHPYTLPLFPMEAQRLAIASSNIGSPSETAEMLRFCADHDVAAEIELIGADEINAAYDRVVASDVRYRFVIDASSFRAT